MLSTVKSNCNQGHNPLCPVGSSAKMYKVTDNTIMDVDAFKVHSKCMFLNVLTKRNSCNVNVLQYVRRS